MFQNLRMTFFSVIEWHALKKALIILGISVVLGIICFVGGYIYSYQQSKQVNALGVDLSLLNTQLMRKKEASQIVDGHYIETYENFIKNGFFLKKYDDMEIDIQRGQMVESIRLLISQLNFPPSEINSYQFDEQRHYQVSYLEMEPEYKVYVAPLTLRLGILHEGDVLHLLKSIESQNIRGQLNVQRCDIERLQEINREDASKPYFKMTCVLLWYTSKLIGNS